MQRALHRGSARSGVLLAVALALAAGNAAAQSDPVAEARAHFEAGASALERSDYATAARELEASLQLRRSHVVQVNLAQAYLGLERLVDAQRAFARGLLEGQGRWNEEQLIELRDTVARLEARLASVRLRHLGAMARVSVDGAEVALVSEELWLTPGTHRIVVTQPGFATVERSFTVAAGQSESWSPGLRPFAAVVIERREQRFLAPPRPPLGPPLAVLVAGAAMLGAGAGLALAGATGPDGCSHDSPFVIGCLYGTTPERLAEANTNLALSYASVPLLAVGGALSLLGTAWLSVNVTRGRAPPIAVPVTPVARALPFHFAWSF